MKVVTSLDIGQENLNFLRKEYPHIEFCIYNKIEKASKDLKDAEVFLTYGFDTTEEILNTMPNLKWIQCMSTGVDALPFKKISKKNILLTNVTGIHGIPIAEYVMAIILSHRIEIFQFYEQQKTKAWKRKNDFKEIYNKTITIVGTGTIGKEIARKAKAFDMKTIGVNTSGKAVDYFDKTYSACELNKALSKGNFIVQTVPLIKETYKMIGMEQFKAMGEDAYFINIGRGKTVDEKALIEALKSHVIKGAAIDVFEIEPLPKESPLWAMENALITPHISGLSNMYMNRALPIFEHNLKVYLGGIGEYINKIDLNKKY
ncbi:MAG: D-2-hydroxyacid dehydrogenase [Epulopiscium sp.]|nr:D-2-hydroxyacid dehydrogenase [Candidatus Epulonipiscium sp.]